MPGVLGLIRRGGDPALPARFDKALQRMHRHGSLPTERVQDPAGEWMTARCHLGVLQPAAQGATAEGVVVWLHGDLWNTADLAHEVGLTDGESTSADLVARLYRREGSRFPSRLKGAYLVVVLDPAERRLTIASDLVGSYPLYWRSGPAEFAFCSDLSSLLLALESKPALDMRAVGDYLTMGFVLGDKTLVEGVKQLGPGETLVFDWESRALQIDCYASLVDLFHAQERSPADYIDALESTFATAVERSLSGNHSFALSLSGGLDSRAILSAINGDCRRITTYTLGIEGCADQVIARRLASIAGTDHKFFELNESYLRDFLPNLATMVALTDGFYLSHGLTEMLALEFIGETRSNVLLRGHGGELAKASLAWPLHTDDTVHALRDLGAFADYISRRVNYLTPNLPLGELLTPAAAARAVHGGRDSLDEVLADTGLRPAQASSYLYLEHHRRYSVPSLELFRTRIEVRLPFVDPDFLRVLLSAPPRWRDGTNIHRAIVRRGNPALLKVRNSNTGAAADAGPTTEWAFDKLNTLLKRANVRGFRHYHNFDGWMRRMLLQTVEEQLLGQSASIHQWVKHDALKRLVSETASGSANHGYLLQALLILELWQRQNGVAPAV